jgi:hypothetical protein
MPDSSMTQKEIESKIEEKIEAHLKAADLKPGSPKYNQIYMHLIIGEEPDALYFLASIVAKKTKSGKIKWNLFHPLYQFDNKYGFLSNLNESKKK